MTPRKSDPILAASGMRDTQPRRLVLAGLKSLGKPVSHKEIHEWILGRDAAVSLVTVYRILEKFQGLGIVHRHPSSGGVMLCSLEGVGGHHGFLSCRSCGKVEEFADRELCRNEDRIAKKAGFTPHEHMSEIVGVCSSCS